MGAEDVKRDGLSYWIRVGIWLAVSLAGWFLAPGEIITAYGMKIAFIFVGLMFGWICLDLIYPSFLAIILVCFAGTGSANVLFYAGFGSDIVVTIIVLTTFCAYASKVGLDNTIAQWFISRKFLQNRPWLFVTVFFVLVYLLGIMIDIYPTIFLLWPVMYRICDEAGFERRGPFTSYMCFAITFICGLGMLSKPFSAWSLVGLNALSTYLEGYTINYSLYTLYMLIVSAVIVLTYLFIGRFIMRLDLTPLKENKISSVAINFDGDQKICALFLVIFFIMMYAPSLLPDQWWLTAALQRLGVIGAGALLLVILGVARKKGLKLANVESLAQLGVPWQIIFLMVGNAVIAGALKSADAGIVPWMGAVFGPLVKGLSPIAFYIVLILIYGISTQFVHNVVLLSIFTPIALTFGDLIGANPIVITFIGIVILSAALATAGASSRSGLVFGNTAWISPKWAYFLGVTSVILVMAAYAIIGIPLAMVMFPF